MYGIKNIIIFQEQKLKSVTMMLSFPMTQRVSVLLYVDLVRDTSKKSIPHFKEILIMWYVLLLEFYPCSCLRAFKVNFNRQSQNDDVYGFRLQGILTPKF